MALAWAELAPSTLLWVLPRLRLFVHRHHAPFNWASNRCMSRQDTQLAPRSIDMAALPVLFCVAASSDLNPSLGVLHASSVGFRHVVLEEDKGEGRG
jgi:hypothetical protein